MTSSRGTLPSDLRRDQVLIMFACCVTLCGFKAEAARVLSETNIMQDSSGFGYHPLANLGSDGITPEKVISTGNSKPTTVLGKHIKGDTSNPKMFDPITLPRCGYKDTVESKTGDRTRRYVLWTTPWPKKNLTYRIAKYTNDLDKVDVDQTFAEAFAMWSDHTDLTFSPGKGKVDIEISFERGDHGDGYPFEESQNADLAHADSPLNGGTVHFNDYYNWTTSIDSDNTYNLLATAVHEIGHSLGLDHSKDNSSAMYYQVSTFDHTLKLASDDIKGIQALYGNKTVVGNVRKFCADPLVDTIFSTAEGHRYVFKGQNYWRLTDDGFAAGYPKLIVTTWIGLPSRIDLAYTNKLGETYFYKGSKYWKFVGKQMKPGYPKKNDARGTPTQIFLWNSYIKARRRYHSLSMKYYCFLDSMKSIFRFTALI